MVWKGGLKALTNGNMKIHKVLALPPSLEDDAIYFVKNGTGADLYIVSNEGVATKVSSGVDYGLTLGESTTTAYQGDRGKYAYDHAQSPHVETKTDIGLGHVNNTSDLDKPISTATQVALDTKTEPLTISETAPMSPEEGDLWFNSLLGQLYTYYLDGSSGQWVSTGGGFNNNSFDIADVQGYYSLLTGFYFDGSATETEIDSTNVNTWVDVIIDPDPNGVFDYRTTLMKSADPVGITGDGSEGSPIVFNLEGLSLRSSANFRSSLSFEPDTDESVLETRLLFNRHSGTTPSQDFSIEEVTLNMTQGADIEYSAEPMLSFFVGDTIDTNGTGDAGQCRFQVKSSVEGTLRVRALTWYIQQ